MTDTTHVTAHMKGPKGYSLIGAVQKTTVRAVKFGRTKSPQRTAGAILLALAVSLGLWALVAAGWLIFD